MIFGTNMHNASGTRICME